MEKGVPAEGMLMHAAGSGFYIAYDAAGRKTKMQAGISVHHQDDALLAPLTQRRSKDMHIDAHLPVGTVTSGGFSHVRGCGVGKGCCEARAIRNAFALAAAHGQHHLVQSTRKFYSGPWACVLLELPTETSSSTCLRPALVTLAS